MVVLFTGSVGVIKCSCVCCLIEVTGYLEAQINPKGFLRHTATDQRLFDPKYIDVHKCHTFMYLQLFTRNDLNFLNFFLT